MKVLVVFSAVMVCALSQVAYPYYSPFGVAPYNAFHYSGYPYSAVPYSAVPYHAYSAPVAVAAPVVVPTSSQYHAQDELGQFTFGTSGDNQARVETKTVDGTVTGAYSYVDPNGKLINVNYLADHNGFRVLGANNLPEAPVAPVVPALMGPEPVQDTPEVVAAKADFMKKFDEAKAAADAAPDTMTVSRKKRQAIFYSAPTAVYAPALAKSTLKYSTFEPVDAKVPADTKKIELKEKETEVLTHVAPLAYTAPLAYSTPFAYNYGIHPVARSPFFYHI